MHVYKTIAKAANAEYKDRGSRFIALLFPIQSADDFKLQLKELKNVHPKAAHHCFAYRIGTDGNNFRSSDDGEPAGSAGKPILGQLDSRGVTNAAIVVVRYFGGTLLGVPGLIQAYKTTSSLALQLTPIVEKPVLISFRLECDYTRFNEVMELIKKHHAIIQQQEVQLFCSLQVGVPSVQKDDFLAQIENMPGVVCSML